MKETEQKIEDKIENVKQISIENQKVYIGSAKPMAGHKTFEVNYVLKTISYADFEVSPVKFEEARFTRPKDKIAARKKITVKKDCVYISALNKKNVLKILKRDFGIVF